MSLTLKTLRPEETLPRFREVEALLADCPAGAQPSWTAPEWLPWAGVSAWCFFAGQENDRLRLASAKGSGWRGEERQLRDRYAREGETVAGCRRFLITAARPGKSISRSFTRQLVEWFAEEPPHTEERVTEILEELFVNFGPEDGAWLVWDGDNDTLWGVLR